MIDLYRRRCPECGTEHVHPTLHIALDTPMRFEAVTEDGDAFVVREVPEKGLPEELTISFLCCACDWYEERPARLG